VAIDVATGERRFLTHGDAWYAGASASPGGRYVVCIRGTFGSPDEATNCTLWLFDLTTGENRDLTPELDLWPESPVWAHDSTAVFFSADKDGGVAALRVDLADGAVTTLVSDGAFSELCPTPDGSAVYALRSTISNPARIVRFDAHTADQSAVELPNGIDEGGVAAGSRVERLTATAVDGTSVRSWLALPPDASPEKPAPARRIRPRRSARHVGRLALALEPAPSDRRGLRGADAGSGHLARLRAAHGPAWLGRLGRPRRTRTSLRLWMGPCRPDLDSTRTALMGGSFGGYMANWVAGQTDRFRCIVTHASLWDLRPFHGTTDTASFGSARSAIRTGSPTLRAPLACGGRGLDQDADAGNPRRAGFPRAGQRGAEAVDGPAAPRRPRRASSTSPTRTTGSSSPRTRGSGTRRCWRSSTSTFSGWSGSDPRCRGARSPRRNRL
jgi:hypothetical protein